MDTNYKKIYGEKLKYFRNNLSLSTHELHRVSKVSQSYISRIEIGDRENISEEKIMQLADALCVPVHCLLQTNF